MGMITFSLLRSDAKSYQFEVHFGILFDAGDPVISEVLFKFLVYVNFAFEAF